MYCTGHNLKIVEKDNENNGLLEKNENEGLEKPFKPNISARYFTDERHQDIAHSKIGYSGRLMIS